MKPLSLYLIITILALLFLIYYLPCCLADIQYTKLRPRYQKHLINPSLLFIDDFGFTEAGRLELNISDISFSNSKNLNLSLVGFFLAPRLSTLDGRMDVWDESEICYLQSDYVKRLYTFERGGLVIMNNKTLDFEFSVSNPNVFNLFFQNCLLPQKLQVSMNIRTSMYNLDPRNGGFHNYLSAGKNYLIRIYFILACIYIFLTGFSIRALNVVKSHASNNDNCVFHYLMLIFTLHKLLSFGVQSANLHYMQHNGNRQTFEAVLFTFISTVLFSAKLPLYVFLTFFISGWTFLIPAAKKKPESYGFLHLYIFVEMTTNLMVFLCSVLDSSFSLVNCVVLSVTSHFFNFAINTLSLVPLLGNTIDLLHKGQVGGNNALIFRKVKIFRQLYFGIVSYGYFSFFVVTGFDMLALYTKYSWTGVLVEEFTILAIHLFIVWTFWPVVPVISNEDEEIAAAEALKDWKTYGLKIVFFGCLFSDKS